MGEVRAAFRVDASVDSGAGHIMRCLTLARALSENGVVCDFVCRAHPGNLIRLIKQQGYEVHELIFCSNAAVTDGGAEPYAGWLGARWEDDADQTRLALADDCLPQWLVVDHYGIDERWEKKLRNSCHRLLVIDDLANRRHDADILLDQTLGRVAEDYRELVGEECELLCGVENVLLRTEFEYFRPQSLARRTRPELKKILISLGGVDKDNLSRDILQALQQDGLLSEVQVCIVLGESAPWIDEVRELVSRLGSNVELKVAVFDMAKLMAESDLAIGAAGTAAWERCCLGLPSIMLMLAENQREIAARISEAGAAVLLFSGHDFPGQVARTVRTLQSRPDKLRAMSNRGAMLVPRSGAGHLARLMAGAFS